MAKPTKEKVVAQFEALNLSEKKDAFTEMKGLLMSAIEAEINEMESNILDLQSVKSNL